MAKIKEKVVAKKEEKKITPYDETNKVEKIKIFNVISPRSQADFYQKMFIENGVNCIFQFSGQGTAPEEINEIMGLVDNKKSLTMGLVKESDLSKIKELVLRRFNTSPSAKGIAFTIDASSVAGLIIYKFLINNREENKQNGKRK